MFFPSQDSGPYLDAPGPVAPGPDGPGLAGQASYQGVATAQGQRCQNLATEHGAVVVLVPCHVVPHPQGSLGCLMAMQQI